MINQGGIQLYNGHLQGYNAIICDINGDLAMNNGELMGFHGIYWDMDNY